MTSFNYTAVAATDLLTKVAHGLNTGDGPGTTLVAGGAVGGVTDSDDHWVIRISADTFKLATSSANALAGIPINITADHSGIFGIGLPYRRARTYVASTVDVAGAQIRSADLNSLMAAEVGLKHGSMPFVFPAASFSKYSGAAVLTSGQWIGIGTFILHLPFAPGIIISSLMWGYNRGGAGTMTLTLGEANPLPPFAATGLFAPQITAGTGYTKTDYTGADIVAAGANKTLPANSGWSLSVDHTNAANVFGGLIIRAARE